jgi:hypothetical protein
MMFGSNELKIASVTWAITHGIHTILAGHLSQKTDTYKNQFLHNRVGGGFKRLHNGIRTMEVQWKDMRMFPSSVLP